MKEYVNMDTLKSDLREILATQIANVKNEPYFELTIWADNDNVEDYADCLANKLNEDMGRYLHMDGTHINGNFNNIRYDYKGDFAGMVKRLDDGADDEQTNADRDFLTAWFWDTFGTWAIGYNFATELDESLYLAEKEETMTA